MAAACTGGSDGLFGASPDLPCGACPTCKQMAQGHHPDLIQIGLDPKRKAPIISVAQIRELLRQVRLRPYNARWRTVILDPADAMRDQAANALLKTLEEPPPGTGFILVTNRVSALLPTILSRSQRVRFRPVPELDLAEWLTGRDVAQPERVAAVAMGCPGQALALSDGGLAAVDQARDDLLVVLSGGIGGLFPALEKLSRAKDAKLREAAWLMALEGLLRDAALCASGAPGLWMNSDRPEVVQAWAGALWPGGLGRLQVALDEVRQRAEVNVNVRLRMESLLSQVVQELGPAIRVGA